MRSPKRQLQYILQKTFGLRSYLYYFALYTIRKLSSSEQEQSLLSFASLIRQSRRQGLIVDIGANIGVTVAHFADVCTNNILAIEPATLNLDVLRRVLKHFQCASRVQIEQCALGPMAGECTIRVPMSECVVYHGLSSVSEGHAESGKQEYYSEEQVPLLPLDKVVEGHTIAAIKMDVENFEYEVLRGADTLLRSQHPPLLTELWDNEVRTNCFALMKSYDYTCFVLRGRRFVPVEGDVSQDLDFLFLHRDDLQLAQLR